MEITLIRHLPTEWNQKGLLQGRKDIPLLPLTSHQSEQVNHNLELIKRKSQPKIILTSSLKRTQQTARLYGINNYEIESLLDEWDFGEFEGKPKKDLISTFGPLWHTDPRSIFLGESGENFEERICQFLQKYKDIPSLLVFGHGAWIRALLSYTRNGTINKMNQIHLDNNQCVTINYEKA